MEKHPKETEFQQKYGNTGGQFDQQTTPMDQQNMGGRPYTTSLKGCQHSQHLQKKETKQNVVITDVYLFFLQPARSLLGSY